MHQWRGVAGATTNSAPWRSARCCVAEERASCYARRLAGLRLRSRAKPSLRLQQRASGVLGCQNEFVLQVLAWETMSGYGLAGQRVIQETRCLHIPVMLASPSQRICKTRHVCVLKEEKEEKGKEEENEEEEEEEEEVEERTSDIGLSFAMTYLASSPFRLSSRSSTSSYLREHTFVERL